MKNRLFLAVFLSLLVMIIYPRLLYKLYPQHTNSIKQYHDTVSTQKGKGSTFNAQPIVKKEEIKNDTVHDTIYDTVPETDKPVTLSSSNYTVELRARNGSIRNIFLNRYHEIDSKQPISLILSGSKVGIFSLLNFEEGPYEIKEARSDSITLRFVRSNGVEVTKTISLIPDSYGINLVLKFKNLGPSPVTLNYGLMGLSGLFQDKGQDARFFEAINSVDGKAKKENIRSLMQGGSIVPGDVSYVLQRNKYFCLILKPVSQTDSERYHSVSFGIIRYHSVSLTTQSSSSGMVSSVLNSADFEVSRNEEVVHSFVLFAGPNDYDAMKGLNMGFEETLTFGLLSGIGQVLLMLLRSFNKVIHNYGVSIIFLTGLVGVILLPLTMKNVKAMKAMQQLQPHIARLKEEYKDNPQKLNKEIMQLYAKQKVNPLGGCLPMVLQMPIFIALYQALVRSLELRGAKFLWIKDLSRPDSAFILPSALPFLGNSINLLPILMIFAMILQQKGGGVDKGTQTQEQRMMAQLMPILFGLLFYNLPSGLVLYWLTNTLFMLFIQKALIHKTN